MKLNYPIAAIAFCLVLFAHNLSGQASKNIPSPAIRWERSGTEFTFRIDNEPYLQPATNSDTYFSYHWEFGDGHFSRDKKVARHTFSKAGRFRVRLYLTPCGSLDFINGVSETVIDVPMTAVGAAKPFPLAANERLNFQTSHNLRTGENMVATLTYRGTGTLILFFNEKKVSKKIQLLKVVDTRRFNNEKLAERSTAQDLPLVQKIANEFASYHIVEATKTTPSVNNVFLEFDRVLENRLLLGQFVKLTAVLVNGNNVIAKELNLKLEQSHDPNDISVSPHFPDYREIGFTDFKYRIRFQNIGNGIEPSVFIKVNRPPSMDTSRFELLETSPKCRICPKNYTPQYRDTVQCLKIEVKADSIEFRFYGINLRGTRQQGVEDMELTKGFVRYRLYPKRGITKLNFGAQAGINFGGKIKRTNVAEVGFKAGAMLGVKVGVNYDYKSKLTNYFIGAALSPYKPVGPYLQFEILADVTPQNRFNTVVTNQIDRIRLDAQNCADCYRDSISEIIGTLKQHNLSLIPLQVRWDLSKVLTIGLGVNADVFMRRLVGSEYIETRKVLPLDCYWTLSRSAPITYEKTSFDYRFNAFGDIEFGLNRLRFGGRLYLPLAAGVDYNRSTWGQVYTLFRF